MFECPGAVARRCHDQPHLRSGHPHRHRDRLV